MSVSPLTLALSVFQQNDHRVIEVNKAHPLNFHLYYIKDSKKRVMIIPKECSNPQRLQSEVQTLLSRNPIEQQKIGKDDGSNK